MEIYRLKQTEIFGSIGKYTFFIINQRQSEEDVNLWEISHLWTFETVEPLQFDPLKPS